MFSCGSSALTSLLVAANLAQLIATSQPEAHDVLSSALGDYCTMFCNGLFADRL